MNPTTPTSGHVAWRHLHAPGAMLGPARGPGPGTLLPEHRHTPAQPVRARAPAAANDPDRVLDLPTSLAEQALGFPLPEVRPVHLHGPRWSLPTVPTWALSSCRLCTVSAGRLAGCLGQTLFRLRGHSAQSWSQWRTWPA